MAKEKLQLTGPCNGPKHTDQSGVHMCLIFVAFYLLDNILHWEKSAQTNSFQVFLFAVEFTGCRQWGRTVRCARAVRKVGCSPPPGVW